MNVRAEALARSIAARLQACDEQELIAIDRMVIAVEKRRDVLDAFPVERTGEFSREEALAMWRASSVASR